MTTTHHPHGLTARVLIVGLPETIDPAAAFLSQTPGVAVVGAALACFDSARRPRTPVLGSADDLRAVRDSFHFTHAVIALPRVMRDAEHRIRRALSALGVPSGSLPGPADLLSGRQTPAVGGSADDVDAAALLGREGGRLDDDALERARLALAGKRVLITGAGGSIGSELAMVVAALEPEELILMERSENSLFEIDRRLGARHPGLARRAMLHDIVEAESTLRWLQELRPHAVFHAAAHKHVTIMEDHPAHAVNNNFFGTKSITDASREAGVERLVMISTDKAVNPTSVMGATKRFAEIYVHGQNARPGVGGVYRMVRFGNVLGSACSVIPVWMRQVGEGGPVTVTHPEMTRFFMTIPEAASLVVQAGALTEREAAGADVFVLDMGEPVAIVELAERFVRALGLEPRFPGRGPAGRTEPLIPSRGPTMDIVFIGARPGEKLHEELAHEEESLRPTPAEGVLAWAAGASPHADAATSEELVRALSDVRWSPDPDEVLDVIQRFAPAVGKDRVKRLRQRTTRNTRPEADHKDLHAA